MTSTHTFPARPSPVTTLGGLVVWRQWIRVVDAQPGCVSIPHLESFADAWADAPHRACEVDRDYVHAFTAEPGSFWVLLMFTREGAS